MDDPEIPFTEDDYRKRRASPNYKDHIALEKLAIKLGKSLKKSLSCYVVCSGVPYGNGEHMLHSFFKRAWLGEQARVSIHCVLSKNLGHFFKTITLWFFSLENGFR